MKSLRILGIRGLPASHGGFETFAEHLCGHLVARGWRVVVYCQESGAGEVWRDEWMGIERIHVPVRQAGPLGTIIFDWKSLLHASRSPGLCLTLGYNTAVFCSLLRIRGVPNVINMDGIEWSRAKWGKIAKLWLWFNEWAGSRLGNHLVADHPEIKKHLSRRVSQERISTIAYGAEDVRTASDSPLARWGLKSGQYLTLIARAEPENSVLEAVEGFSRQSRGIKLVVLGNYSRTHSYQRQVLDAASDEVLFVGAIYDKTIVQALRFHSLAYVHGHQVGGTNPSLVEALGAGNAVIAHDNRFNRWVAGDSNLYFSDAVTFGALVDRVLIDRDLVERMKKSSLMRFQAGLTWPQILDEYETLLDGFQDID